ncbi:hypothetical protein PFICI_12070 [Pestalotiopsis fici W106-1]|uniref:DNA repair protein RAD16 n=1 Tax=Pestalotiopsis fici (strain W106-1 / CGMCC3.15140) TaxID=1229662 RepID=W3WS62_PESFW|nr:uncharacterized protein PFICI_12070 [Pestalotiopsis fici W106-1]ETS76683.1 hypothetical protein PFICI_12070 [Pestalotiopsis fici W106-1]
MAPRTRRSLGVNGAGVGDNNASPAATDPGVTPSVAPKKRGRPSKVEVPSTSVSSIASPALSISDTGEYSTPATSHDVTPGVAANGQSTKTTRSRIVIELPAGLQDDDDDELSAFPAPTTISSRTRSARRSLRPAAQVVEDSDDDMDLDFDPSPDATLARRLQKEEYAKAAEERDTPFIDESNYEVDNASSMDLDYGSGSSEDEALATSAPARKKAKAVAKSKSNAKTRAKPAKNRKAKSKAALLTAPEYTPDPDDPDADAPGFETPSDFSQWEITDDEVEATGEMGQIGRSRHGFSGPVHSRRAKKERLRLEFYHPELKTMWGTLKEETPAEPPRAEQPTNITRTLKPFQLEGLAWMKKMEQDKWNGGILGDEMGLGKTIQAVSLIMSDYPAKQPSLVLVPPVALMQWKSEIESYTDGTLKVIVFHGTNSKAKDMTAKQLKAFDVIMMSYNTLESMYRRQEKGFQRKDGLLKTKSAVHTIHFHRVILDEAHSIKTRTTMTAKACFALNTTYRWCLTGTPLQNRIGEFFSLIRFLNMAPFASYFCRSCPCSTLEWDMNDEGRCKHCNHGSMRHVSVFNQELLNPIQKYNNKGPGAEAFKKLRLMTNRIMLRRLKKDHTNSMELPVKEIFVERQFFGEAEHDFSSSLTSENQRQFNTYVAQGVMLNNYANIFGLIMQMRQVADHPDLILKKSAEGGQNVLQCCICDEPAEQAIRSKCRHDFCRSCAKSYLNSQDQPDCPKCHIPLSIDLEQPEIEQDEALVKKSSIINRINMENWTSSSKIELLVHELHSLRSDSASHKSIIFSQFTTMLQLIEWRLRRAGITTVMLDGSMTPAQRQASIDHFMSNVDVECFLVSLKAGGVALNLTEASRVFIVDPWWNPAAEWQSADRCHRIGQTRPCTITRLCIEDSVESRIVHLQEKKTSMINSTINSDDAAMESLTPEDLQFLFKG